MSENVAVIVDRFYIVLFSALEQTHCACTWFYMIWITSFLYSFFLISTKVLYLQCWRGRCHMKLLLSQHVLCTPYTEHFSQDCNDGKEVITDVIVAKTVITIICRCNFALRSGSQMIDCNYCFCNNYIAKWLIIITVFATSTLPNDCNYCFCNNYICVHFLYMCIVFHHYSPD